MKISKIHKKLKPPPEGCSSVVYVASVSSVAVSVPVNVVVVVLGVVVVVIDVVIVGWPLSKAVCGVQADIVVPSSHNIRM